MKKKFHLRIPGLHMQKPGNHLLCQLTFWMVLSAGFVCNAQVRLVADLNPTRSITYYPDEFSDLTSLDGVAYFVVANSMLWKSDGTTEGSVLVATHPGMSGLTAAPGKLYFTASAEETGSELWISDGTPEGTKPVKDIYPGAEGSNPGGFVVMNGVVYFAANDGTHGIELWRSDGSEDGTFIVKDIFSGSQDSNPSWLTVHDGNLYFAARHSNNSPSLWRSDGTSVGTINLSAASVIPFTDPEQLVTNDDILFFFATDLVNGRNLWKSDGSEAGTLLVTPIGPKNANDLDNLTASDEGVFFQADDGIHGTELWKSDGTASGTMLVKDLTPGPESETGYGSPHLRKFFSFEGKLYFLTEQTGTTLWVSDGTDAGTVQLTEPLVVSFTWMDPWFQSLNGKVFFVAYHDEQSALGLFVTDGTAAGTQLVKGYVGAAFDNGAHTIHINNRLLFFGYSDLWKSDGTSEGTVKVLDLTTPAGSSPRYFSEHNGELYFVASQWLDYVYKTGGTAENTLRAVSGFYVNNLETVNGMLYFSGNRVSARQGLELWKSDGTQEGTVLVRDIAEGRLSSDPADYTRLPGGMLFTARTAGAGRELWLTNGTTDGTTLVSDINPGQNSSNPAGLTAIRNEVFFHADNGASGEELWKSNGTPASTRMVYDIFPGPSSSGITDLISDRKDVFFFANDGVHGYELWKTNGKASGTRLVKDLRTGDRDAGRDVSNMINSGKALYFAAILQNGLVSLIKSTGTPNGTKSLRQFNTQHLGSMLGVLDKTVIFSVRFPDHTDLWQTDGRTSGTVKIRSLDNDELSAAANPVVMGGALYFSAKRVDGSFRIWRTDGSEEGTYFFDLEGEPFHLSAHNNVLYFSGYSNAAGRELFALDENAPAIRLDNAARTAVNSEATVEESKAEVSCFPNPFDNSFILRVSGEAAATFSLNVIRVNGTVALRETGLHYNRDYSFGEGWNNGLYILQIRTLTKTVTRKVIRLN